MSTTESSPNPGSSAQSLQVREVFSRAWPLFKACLPVCLPLAVIGVAAGATPSADGAAGGEGHGLAHSRQWWGLLLASTVLTLICYGAVLRQQLALVAGERVPVLASMRDALRDVPLVLPLLLLLTLPLLPAMIITRVRGFDLMAALLTLAALGVLMHALFAWIAMVERRLNPWSALLLSVRVVRVRRMQVLALLGTLLFAVLVFVLLVGILTAVVMGLAGQDAPGPSSLALSRWLMAVILAVPVVYGGALAVTAWRMVTAVPASPGDPAPRPGA